MIFINWISLSLALADWIKRIELCHCWAVTLFREQGKVVMVFAGDESEKKNFRKQWLIPKEFFSTTSFPSPTLHAINIRLVTTWMLNLAFKLNDLDVMLATGNWQLLMDENSERIGRGRGRGANSCTLHQTLHNMKTWHDIDSFKLCYFNVAPSESM